MEDDALIKYEQNTNIMLCAGTSVATAASIDRMLRLGGFSGRFV